MSEIIKHDLIDEKIYKTVLSNGLTVLCCERPERVGVYAIYGAKIGSVNTAFECGGKRCDVPAGVAHFLEHKLFEGKDGEDAFSLFAATGASANAFTSFDKTCYLFSSNENARQSLEILLDFVNSPYFTKENVEKEQGIIGQEIKMYDDSDGWQLLVGALGLLYSEHPIKNDIAGTVESISHITEQTLYDCYNAFYSPGNMVLSVAGNITNDEVLEIARAAFEKSDRPSVSAVSLFPDERPEVGCSYGEKEMSIAKRQFCLAYKEAPFGEKSIAEEVVLDVALDAIFGETSDFYRRLYDEGSINQTFSYEVVSGATYRAVLFLGEADNPQAVKESIAAEIVRAKTRGIDCDRFEEARRANLGDEILDFESNEDIAAGMAFLNFKGGAPFDAVDVLRKTEVNQANALISDMFERSALFVINPKVRA